jgi:hypothetical protein
MEWLSGVKTSLLDPETEIDIDAVRTRSLRGDPSRGGAEDSRHTFS